MGHSGGHPETVVGRRRLGGRGRHSGAGRHVTDRRRFAALPRQFVAHGTGCNRFELELELGYGVNVGMSGMSGMSGTTGTTGGTPGGTSADPASTAATVCPNVKNTTVMANGMVMAPVPTGAPTAAEQAAADKLVSETTTAICQIRELARLAYRGGLRAGDQPERVRGSLRQLANGQIR